ncbi:MAG: TIGR02186 family protein [Paracoccaceae bacterium]
MIRCLLIVLVFLALPVRAAEEVVAGMSQNRISITANFDGSEILVFGAVKREDKIPDGPLDVIVTVQGPSTPLIVRHKERRFGIWVNVEEVRFTAAPSFYAIATTRPLDKVLSATDDLRYKVTIPKAIRVVGTSYATDDPASYAEAVLRIRRLNGLYQQRQGSVDISEQTLFRTEIKLPANLTEGSYSTRIFLTRGGRVVDVHESVIEVRKEGLERWFHRMAHEEPWGYAVIALVLAVASGWAASEAFRLMRS